MRIPPLIHFFGPDGAGKSTHARMLVSYLQKRGIPARIWWVRSPHTVAFVFWRLFVRIGFYRVATNPFGVPVKLPAVNRNKTLRLIWSILEFLGVLPLVFRTHLRMFMGQKLVAERYLLDTVTTIAYFEDDVNFLDSCFSRFLLKSIPRDTIFIFLDSDFKTIFQRRAHLFAVPRNVSAGCSKARKGSGEKYGQVPRGAVEPSDFINFQRMVYNRLAKSTSALVIDTSTSSVKETFHTILQHLGLN